MRNITATVKGTKLILEIDVSKESLEGATPSASGKTKIVATSGGNTPIALPGGGQVVIGVNAYIK